MKLLRDASENEVISHFLKGEYSSVRFAKELQEAMKKSDCGENVILNPNLAQQEENNLRRQVMADFRGWGMNIHMFQNFPSKIHWQLMSCTKEDLDHLRYIRYSYWDELSRWTGRPRSAAITIREGREIFGVSNAPALTGEDYLRQGGHFPALITLTGGDGDYVLLEGHSRATVYGLVPEAFAGTQCYVGLCDPEELAAWAGPRLHGQPLLP